MGVHWGTDPVHALQLEHRGAQPKLWSSHSKTRVTLVCEGLVQSERCICRADFPEDFSEDVRRILYGEYDNTVHEISVAVPSLRQERLRRVDALEAANPKLVDRVEEDGEDSALDAELPPPTVDPNGGLNGLRVPIELTLNGQNFTADGVEFVYYGELEISEAEATDEELRGKPLVAETEILCPVGSLPEDVLAREACVRFKVILPTCGTRRTQPRPICWSLRRQRRFTTAGRTRLCRLRCHRCRRRPTALATCARSCSSSR